MVVWYAHLRPYCTRIPADCQTEMDLVERPGGITQTVGREHAMAYDPPGVALLKRTQGILLDAI